MRENEVFRLKKYITRTDGAVIAAVLLLCLCGYVFFAVDFFGEETVIKIVVDGKNYASYPISQLTEIPKEIPIYSKNGKNILKISSSGAQMVYADCPNQLDIRQGLIRQPGEMIVCLPNRVVVSIEGKSGMDGISY